MRTLFKTATLSLASLIFLAACSDGGGSSSATDDLSAVDAIDNPSAVDVIDDSSTEDTIASPTSVDPVGTLTSIDLAVDDISDSGTESVPDDSIAEGNPDAAGESILPSVFPPANAPTDCMLDVDDSGNTYCYSASTRELRAWSQNGADWWRFELPGESTSNDILSLTVVGDQLIITAILNRSTAGRSFELSAFSLDGAFGYTVPILESIRDDDGSQAFDITTVERSNDGLLVAGNYSGGQAPGAYLTQVDVSDGVSMITQRYPGLSYLGELQRNESGIVITLSEIPWLVDEATFALVQAQDANTQNSITVDNYAAQSTRFLELLSYPPIDLLKTTVTDWYFKELDRVSNDLDNCPGGGTVSQSFTSSSTAGDSRTFIFDNCASDRFTLDGELFTNSGNFCGQDCTGPISATVFTDFTADFANGDRWIVDVDRRTQTRRINFVMEGELPPPVYTATTTIIQFERDDARGSLVVGPGTYDYRASGDDSNRSWIGSSSMAYNTGLTEVSDIDLAYTTVDGVFSASGNLSASRSDGTSLVVSPGSAGSLLYSITNGDSTEEITSTP